MKYIAASIIAFNTVTKQTNINKNALEVIVAINTLLKMKEPSNKRNIDKLLCKQSSEPINEAINLDLIYKNLNRFFLHPKAITIINLLEDKHTQYLLEINKRHNQNVAQYLKDRIK